MMLFIAMMGVGFAIIRASFSQQSPLLLLAFIVGLVPFGTPIIIKCTHWHSADPRFVPIDPGSDQVPLRIAENLAAFVPRLKALGFRPLGHFLSDRSVPNTSAYVSLYENPKAGQTAHILTAFGVQQVVTSLAFGTEFADDTELVTHNTPIALVLPPGLYREGSMAFPQVSDPGHLYAVHEASVLRFASDGLRIQEEIRDPVEYLRASYQRELAWFAEVGYYRLDGTARVYRATWWGAYIMTWKLLWPIKPIRLLLRRRKAARMLRELGLEWPPQEEFGFDPEFASR